MAGKIKTFENYRFMDGYGEFDVRHVSGKILTVKVDTEDLKRLIEYNRSWNVVLYKNNNQYYVRRTSYIIDENDPKKRKKPRIIFLHKWLFGIEYDKTKLVDHINNDSLDNERSNLRITDTIHNTKNRKGANKNNKSGHRNVFWNKQEKAWVVQLSINGKNKRMGTFNNVDKAVVCAEAARQKYYGDFAGRG